MVAAEIDLTLFGQRMNFGFRFDLQNPFRSITSAKDSGLYTYKEGVKQQTGRTIFDPYDPPNPFSDFDLTGRNVLHFFINTCSVFVIDFQYYFQACMSENVW